MKFAIARPVIATSAAVLSSFAAPSFAAREFQCRGVVCDVEVTVVDAADPTCRIVFADDAQLALRMPKATKTLLRWELSAGSAKGYEFRDDGFLLKSGQPTDQFDKVGATSNGKRFVLKNKNDDGRSYEYALRVHAKGAPDRICLIDPFIHNEN
ncbi:MAG: hypothetical protein OEU93_17705 [Rubrivivax sp.]|nr:hypothetical protein [Rubrivivax sp.]MDH5340386.1 hypothetical protein [Rubrivivax sp.]